MATKTGAEIRFTSSASLAADVAPLHVGRYFVQSAELIPFSDVFARDTENAVPLLPVFSCHDPFRDLLCVCQYLGKPLQHLPASSPCGAEILAHGSLRYSHPLRNLSLFQAVSSRKVLDDGGPKRG